MRVKIAFVVIGLSFMSASAQAAIEDDFELLDNPLTDEVIARDFGTSYEDFKAYGQIAGGAGAAAACTALFTPVVGAICGAAGSVLGGEVVEKAAQFVDFLRDQVIARGSTPNDAVKELIAQRKPAFERAQRNTFAFWVYHTKRVFVVRDLGQKRAQAANVSATEGLQWASKELTNRGAPALSELAEYRPSDSTFDKYVAEMGLLPDGSCIPGGGKCLPVPGSGWDKECKAAIEEDVAATCIEYFTIVNYYGMPPARPGELIDWNRVADSAYGELHANTLLDKLEVVEVEVANAISSHVSLPYFLSEEPNVNRPGMDYTSFNLPAPNPNLCRVECEDSAQCKAYTYVKPGIQGPEARCWLKSGIPPAEQNTCCVSGALMPGSPSPTTASGPPPTGVTVAPQTGVVLQPVIPPSRLLSREPDINLPGMDYTSFDLASPDVNLCAASCQMDPNCKAYTYVKPGIQGPQARCWLKSGIPSAEANACCVSGREPPAVR